MLLLDPAAPRFTADAEISPTHPRDGEVVRRAEPLVRARAHDIEYIHSRRNREVCVIGRAPWIVQRAKINPKLSQQAEERPVGLRILSLVRISLGERVPDR